MALISPSLAERIARRHGVVTAHELIGDGFSHRAVTHHVGVGSIIRIHNGVFRMATAPDTFEARCAAACLADPFAIVSGVAAARLWGFRHVWRPDIPHLLISHERTPITRGVVLRRSNVIDASDGVPRTDGILIACPPRAWFDCARDLDDERFERLTEWVLDHHSSLATLWRLTRRLRAPGRPGLGRVNRVMSRRADWQQPAGSGLELRVLRALEQRGLELVRQYPLRLPDGTTIRVDGADPATRWALEVDHVSWHGGRQEAQKDKMRDRALRRIDWQSDRVTDQELDDDFDGTIDDLVAIHDQRRASVRGRPPGSVA
jgi:very-short-patch-repair endonuclease